MIRIMEIPRVNDFSTARNKSVSYLIDGFIEILEQILAQGKIMEIHYNITRKRNNRKYIINAIFYCKIRNSYTIYIYLKVTKYQILKNKIGICLIPKCAKFYRLYSKTFWIYFLKRVVNFNLCNAIQKMKVYVRTMLYFERHIALPF